MLRLRFVLAAPKGHSIMRFVMLVLCLPLAGCPAQPATPDAQREDARVPVDAPAPDGASEDARVADAPAPLRCTPLAYRGDATWRGRLEVESGSALCAHLPSELIFDNPDFDSVVDRGLSRMLSRKGTVRIVPGSYAIPTVTANSELALPGCVEDPGSTEALGLAPRVDVVTWTESGIGTTARHEVRARLAVGAGMIELLATLPLDPTRVTLQSRATTHLTVTATREDDRLYTACRLVPNRCHQLDLGTLGTGRLDEYTWAASPGLGFAAAQRFDGVVQGVSTTTERYEDLTTVYGHHAFNRYHFVRFASLRGDACGLRIEASVDGEWRAALARCDGTRLGAWVPVSETDVPCAE